MADVLREIFGLFDKRYRDMGDGSNAEVVDIGDRAARELGVVTVDGGIAVDGTIDVSDRAARDLGGVDITSIAPGNTHFGQVGGASGNCTV